jgi:hypothetical protein
MSDQEEPGFEYHFKRLESISLELQGNKITIDKLIPRMKDALKSIEICKGVLKQTKLQLIEIEGEPSFQALKSDLNSQDLTSDDDAELD